MTPEQTVTFIKLMSHHEILSFTDEDPVMLDLGAGVEVKLWFDGTQHWFLNKKLHRTDGPSEILADGSQFWWLNGQRHRDDGPAMIWVDGTQHWWLNGKQHRTDGPAVIWTDGSQFWFLNGKAMTQKEHARRVG